MSQQTPAVFIFLIAVAAYVVCASAAGAAGVSLLPAPLAVGVGTTLVWLVASGPRQAGRQRNPKKFCLFCGHELAKGGGECPECGRADVDIS